MNQTNLLKALNVAEKPSVARTISDVLSKRSAKKKESYSMYNPIFEFEYENKYKMNFTSLVGHLMNYEFAGKDTKKWENETTKKLFTTKIVKEIKEGNEKIDKNLKLLAK